MGYGDWYFYLVALMIVEIVCVISCLWDKRLRALMRRRPLVFQLAVLFLTATALYGSDSNKPPEEPPKPPEQKVRKWIYIHRGNSGGRWHPVNITIKEDSEDE